ncbi:hypothetical protein V3C99_013978 [Haemonchus contortus]
MTLKLLGRFEKENSLNNVFEHRSRTT